MILFLALRHLLFIWSDQLKHLLDSAVEVAAKPGNGLILVYVHNGFAMRGFASYAFMYVQQQDLCNYDGTCCHTFSVSHTQRSMNLLCMQSADCAGNPMCS